METKRHIHTVSELTRNIRALLEDNFGQIWVEGEISNFTRHSSGHMYFSLKDRESVLRTVLFRGVNRGLKFDPGDGIEVICFGRISVYDKHGQYQLIVERIEPRGVGALQLAFEQLKKKLEKEGLFDKKFKKEIPFLPQRVGVVTSPTGAAIRDILNIIHRRFASVEVIINPVKVQGKGSAEEIAQAIDEFNQFGQVDVLIVGRGGGSLEDLWAFNEEVVARSIFSSRIPVISAVGHEIDYTISDFVADLRAPTPSAAAELVVAHKQELSDKLENYYSRIKNAIVNQLTQLESRLEGLSERYAFRQPQDLILQYQQTIDMLFSKLELKVRHLYEMSYQRHKVLEGRLTALSPLNILKRGYSITMLLPDEKVVTDASKLKEGMTVRTRLAQGTLTSRVESVDDKPLE